MTKEEAKSKYNRVAEDKSQLQQFIYKLIDGEIPGAGGEGGEPAFEKIELDLYFNDFDLTGEVPKLINQDKINQFKHIEEKVLNGDLIATVLELPILDYIPTGAEAPDTFGGSFILYPTSILGVLVFTTQYINTSNNGGEITAKNYMFAFAENSQTGNFEMTSLGFPESYLQALFVEMSSNPDTGFKLKCTISSDSGSGSGSSIGGSGKLYEYSFILTRYDLNGNEVLGNNIINVPGPQPISFFIYESNFERIKAIGQDMGFTISSPQDLATIFNQTFNETVGRQSGLTTGVFLGLLFSADKIIAASIQTSSITYNIDANSIISQGVIKAIDGNFLILYDDNEEQPHYYGLNVNNSCTLTEYGTSASGGSGGSIDLSNLQVGHLTFTNNQDNGIKSLGSIWSVLSLTFETQYESYRFWAKYMCSEEEMYDLMNEQLEQYRQQGLIIPTVTDHDTLTQAFNIIIDTLFALDSSGAALTMAGLITLMFGPSVYGPFQGFMKDSGATLFTLIRSGDDFGMCILDAQGQKVDVLQTLVSDIGTTKPTNISVWIND